MKAIVMAAGKGSRISDKIGDIPKSTVLVDGKPVIRITVENLLSLNVDVCVCVGYKQELIRKALEGLDVKYYDNPFYAVTNNVASLWFAQEELNDDTLILSADIYFPKDFVTRIANTKQPMSMLVDSSRIYDGDFYYQVNDDGELLNYGPQLPLSKRNYEYAGFTYIKREMIDAFRQRVVERVQSGKYSIYFEDIALSFAMMREVKIDLIDVADSFWREFDFYDDYQLILEHVAKSKT